MLVDRGVQRDVGDVVVHGRDGGWSPIHRQEVGVMMCGSCKFWVKASGVKNRLYCTRQKTLVAVEAVCPEWVER